ncbi:enoyl-CoA hydratase/carnithine racemase [Phenylobacterium zucineum HLK1]|uniref:Enoyl-CoA hydratase/carnithine racemase n=1 Tax=Phenylobacterium zucineum (strain HLK1) TaxID=450851 RepID=B4RGN8_PHEZH|nr:enoyl-CoA hydratase-related protein [Phenylobacterium zucineum]ACG78944.1 enoyl-CoA hydratase/carnithine racemase [Phenylobacterium zucineum HLK1]
MSAEQSDELLLERRGPVLVALLNRPAKRNAINRAISERLLEAVRQVDEDPGLNAGVLASSTPGMFCAGADLAAMAAGDLLRPDGDPRPSFTRQPRRKPWIAAVAGPALGGGFEMALACEMIVAGENTTFGLPEARRGLLAAGGGVFRAVRALPRAIGMELVLTGRTMDAAEAGRLGLVNRVAPDAEVLEQAVDLAQAVAACAPLAVQESLALARRATEAPETDLWPEARAALTRLMSGADAKEGMRAFLERRAPVWRGE